MYGDKIENSLKEYIDINSECIYAEFKVDIAYKFLENNTTLNYDEIKKFVESYTTFNGTKNILEFDESSFINDVSILYNIPFDDLKLELEVMSDATYANGLKDLKESVRIRMYDV